MEIIKNIDPLLEKQPEKRFAELLSTPVHAEKPVDFGKRKKRKNETAFYSIKTEFNFPDIEGNLEYAYKDFDAFLSCVEIEKKENGKLFRIEKKVVDKNNDEAFTISVDDDGVTVYAGHVEGVRRALIFIEDEMKRRTGPFLLKGEITRKPHVKTRISRCFFTPPSHASAEGSLNELCSDIDYYPEEYLNRLAHDGINGLWIGSSFKKMLKSSYIKEYGFEEEIQIKKLNQVIAKCKKFGIGIYLFVTEPASSCYSPEIRNYPDMIGATTPGDHFTLMCPAKEKTQKYIEEAVTRLFTLAPDLAGLINITVGESLSSCASISKLICPDCIKKFGTLAKAFAATEKMFLDAMEKVAPKAKYISWTYEHRSTPFKDIEEVCAIRDKRVCHMQNFEDLGRPVQLGRKRLAYDYWLSYAGPGKLMRFTAKNNKKAGVTTFAKLQVCSSHEISTVPYVPAPGIIYDKYKFIYENNIGGVLQCWYFGNYPSLMAKSAYELSYTPFFQSKQQFLTYLAKTYFGNEYKNAVNAWKNFEKGYTNFPVNLAFEWVGPMQDSPCCPLHLLPADWPMPGTWLKSERSGGDRIGECLLNGHTIDEAITLVEKMCKFWADGLDYMKAIPTMNSEERDEQLRNATAIKLIFNSGLNVLKFYKLRHLLGTLQGDENTLSKMKNIVLEEIKISTELIPLTEKDIRIGYHSEANGYKIFPEKLKWRIDKLNELLSTEFVEVENRISKGEIPLEFYYGLNDGSTRKIISETPNEKDWIFFKLADGKTDENTALRVYDDNEKIHIQIKTDDKSDVIRIKPEFNIMFPKIPMRIENGKFSVERANAFSVPKDRIKPENAKFEFNSAKIENGYLYTISFVRKTMDMTEKEPFRLGVWRMGKINSTLLHAKKTFASQLIRAEFSPEHYCFFVKE